MKNSRRNRANAAAKAEKRAKYISRNENGSFAHDERQLAKTARHALGAPYERGQPITGDMYRKLANHFKGDDQ